VKFWNWAKNESGESERELYFDGVISEDTWWDDAITPEIFRKELHAGSGSVTVWINSPGGDCVAASRIYTMLIDYKGDVTVKIDGIAASAASVIAMAGDKVLMSPTAMMMIHNPSAIAWGDKREMENIIKILDEFKESIMNAYEIKTGQSRAFISHLMDEETWFSAHKAVELKFADGIIEDEKRRSAVKKSGAENFSYSRLSVANSLIDKVKPKKTANIGNYYDSLYKAKTWK